MKRVLLLLVGLIWAGSSVQAADSAPNASYKLQPGDVLQVVVWKETDLQSEVLIRPDGGISFALAGDLQAAGRSTDELRAELENASAQIGTRCRGHRGSEGGGNRVFVIGKVNRPGDFALNRPIDVMQAISLAGGVTPFASTDHIRVLHREGARLSSIRFRYSQVTKGRNLDQNILLQSGDTVIVP